MKNSYIHILNASHLLDEQTTIIKNAFDNTCALINNLISLDDIDVVCINDPYQVIPETGMSGFTPNRNLVYLYVDASRELDGSELLYTLSHEFSHAKRYDGPGYGETLFDSIIFEGIGVALEDEVSGVKGSFLSNYIKNQDNKALIDKVIDHFDDHDFNHFYWFIQESDELPRWTGYRIGYYIVSEYLKKTNKKASDIILEDIAVFRDFVRDDLGRA